MQGFKTETIQIINKTGQIEEKKITINTPKKAIHPKLNRPRNGLEKQRIWRTMSI